MKTIRETAHQPLAWTRVSTSRKDGAELRAGDELVAVIIRNNQFDLIKLIRNKPFNVCQAQSAHGSWTFKEERGWPEFSLFFLFFEGFVLLILFWILQDFFGGGDQISFGELLFFLAIVLPMAILGFRGMGTPRVKVIEEGSGVLAAVLYKPGKHEKYLLLECFLSGSRFRFSHLGNGTWGFNNEDGEPVVNLKVLKRDWTGGLRSTTVEIGRAALSVPELGLLTLLGFYLMYFFTGGLANPD